MITIEIIIKEIPAEQGHRRGFIEAKFINEEGSPEEISLSARVLEKLRILADEIAVEKGSKVGMWEKHARRINPESDRRTDKDSEQK